MRRQKGGARHKAVDHGGNATHGLFAFLSVDIAQLKSTSGDHTRAQSFAAERVGFDEAERVSNVFRNLPADFVHLPIVRISTPLWTLRINHVASLLLLQIQSYVPLLTAAHRVNEKSRIRFQIVPCNFDYNQDSRYHLMYLILSLQKFYSRFTRFENWN